jgi:hypothetical protein
MTFASMAVVIVTIAVLIGMQLYVPRKALIPAMGLTIALDLTRHGSVSVAVGERVKAGTPIGECGNRGRTTHAHLHIHAQNLPWYAFKEAKGVPIAFTDRRGERVLRVWESLRGFAN